MNNGTRMTELLAALIAVSVLSCKPAFCQLRAAAIEGAGDRLYAMVGGNRMDLKELNTSLEANGYPAFLDNVFSVGGGGYRIVNWVILGGEVHAFLKRDALTATGTQSVSLSGGYGLANIGYVVYTTEDLAIFPLIGIGAGTLHLGIAERGAPSFEGVLQDPRRGASLSSGGLLVSVALGADGLLKLGEDKNSKAGVAVGLSVGYMLAPVKGDWALDQVSRVGGPRVGMTGPFARLMVGGGRVRKT